MDAVRFAELLHTQREKRAGVFTQKELDELRAIQRLAHRLYGDRGVCEILTDSPGVFNVGYFIDPIIVGRPKSKRRVRYTMHGTSVAELEEQARHLGIAGVLRR